MPGAQPGWTRPGWPPGWRCPSFPPAALLRGRASRGRGGGPQKLREAALADFDPSDRSGAGTPRLPSTPAATGRFPRRNGGPG